MKNNFFLIFVFVLFYSCNGLHTKNANLNGFIGSNFIWSDAIKPRIMGRDTVMPSFFLSGNAKIIIYFDSTACSICGMKDLPRWRQLIDTIGAKENDFGILLTFSSSLEKMGEMDDFFKYSAYNAPVFFDYDGDLKKNNPFFPKSSSLHTFLLDKNNKVILVGNPIDNRALKDLYLETIKVLLENRGILPD